MEEKNTSTVNETVEDKKSIDTILYEQLLLLSEQSTYKNTVDEYCALTSAMCQIVKILKLIDV